MTLKWACSRLLSEKIKCMTNLIILLIIYIIIIATETLSLSFSLFFSSSASFKRLFSNQPVPVPAFNWQLCAAESGCCSTVLTAPRWLARGRPPSLLFWQNAWAWYCLITLKAKDLSRSYLAWYLIPLRRQYDHRLSRAALGCGPTANASQAQWACE